MTAIQQFHLVMQAFIECTKYMTGKSHTDPEGKPFALNVMEHMNEACEKWKEETNIDFSI